VLVTARDYNSLYYLKRVLEEIEIDEQDVTVMTVRVMKGHGARRVSTTTRSSPSLCGGSHAMWPAGNWAKSCLSSRRWPRDGRLPQALLRPRARPRRDAGSRQDAPTYGAGNMGAARVAADCRRQ